MGIDHEQDVADVEDTSEESLGLVEDDVPLAADHLAGRLLGAVALVSMGGH